MSACHLDTKQVTPPCFEMFPLTSPQIKFSGGGGGVLEFKAESMLQKYHNNFKWSSGFEFYGNGIFLWKGGGGVVDPYKMTLIVNRWQTGSVENIWKINIILFVRLHWMHIFWLVRCNAMSFSYFKRLPILTLKRKKKPTK